jgi:hypothetical protein
MNPGTVAGNTAGATGGDFRGIRVPPLDVLVKMECHERFQVSESLPRTPKACPTYEL